MGQSSLYEFHFYYDPSGINSTIRSGVMSEGHHLAPVRLWNGVMWQGASIRTAALENYDAYIFLGNPYIVSTWLAAMTAKLKGKPVLYWTHGWLTRETSIKSKLRNLFYRFADGLLLYGTRAKEIGVEQGFNPSKLHVIGNSLNYESQKKARLKLQDWGAKEIESRFGLRRQCYFLVVSRLVQEAQIDLAIRVLAKTYSESCLVIIGHGPCLASLEGLASELNGRVKFLGEVYDEQDLAPLFANAIAVVSPGKVGLLAMHALAYGAAVITHDDLDRQMPEVEALERENLGEHFKYGDVESLAKVMIRVCEKVKDQNFVAARRATAVEVIESNFTPEKQAEKIVEALSQYLKV